MGEEKEVGTIPTIRRPFLSDAGEEVQIFICFSIFLSLDFFLLLILFLLIRRELLCINLEESNFSCSKFFCNETILLKLLFACVWNSNFKVFKAIFNKSSFDNLTNSFVVVVNLDLFMLMLIESLFLLLVLSLM